MACRKKSVNAASAAPALAERPPLRTTLRAAALGGFVVYIGWNVAWLLVGKVPPSMLLALFGLPAPTTGMTRALRALLAGDWLRSLAYNPCTVPTVVLLGLSLVQLVRGHAKRHRWMLDQRLTWAWGATLGLAWLWTLLGTPLHPERLWP